jgi:hypothetical protein
MFKNKWVPLTTFEAGDIGEVIAALIYDIET